MNEQIGIWALEIGFVFVLMGYSSLIYILPFLEKKYDARVGLEGVRALLWLIIGGIIIIILGFLYLMGLLPYLTS